MSKAAGPMMAPATWDTVADAYAQHVMPVFTHYASEALTLAAVPPKSEVVDVAAGPGTLSFLAAEHGHSVTAIDFSRGMIDQLKETSAQRKLKVQAQVGDGMALELPAEKFQAAFSMFGLMMFSSRARGFSELWRVLKPGGRAVVSSWAPFETVPFMAALFGGLSELQPQASAPQRHLETEESCIREMGEAGFSDISVKQVSAQFEAASMGELWAWFPQTCAPLAALQRELGRDYPGLLNKLKSRVEEKLGPGPVRIEMPALLTVGTKR